MKIEQRTEEKYTVLKLLEDRLDSRISPDLKETFVMMNTTGVKNVVLNLMEVKYADSSGLSAMLTGNRLCRNNGGVLVVCHLNDHVEKLMRISHLNEVLNVLPSEDEGIEAIFMHEIEGEIEEKDIKEGNEAAES